VTDVNIELLEKIAKAIKSEKFTQETKSEFAFQILEEMPYPIYYAESKQGLKDLINELSKAQAYANKGLAEFHDLIIKIRGKNHDIKINSELTGIVNYLKKVLKNMKSFNDYFTLIKKEQPKKKTSNLEGISVAEMIAKYYWEYFKTLPSIGNARETNSVKKGSPIRKTPYDRICDLIAEYSKIKLTDYARKEGIKALRGDLAKKK